MKTKTIEEMWAELDLLRFTEKVLSRIVEEIYKTNEILKTTKNEKDQVYLKGVITALKHAYKTVGWLFEGGVTEELIQEIDEIRRKWELEQIERKGRYDALGVVLEILGAEDKEEVRENG